ncbi:hypothetical protein THAOC_37743 [Thalassiosira oceanica]|uniref:Uncharacterized protein n=1 Tax=Thalassiosira oceanica TaxID=159749 RepID=K0QYH1_THAOC|nr:hypothetical protein THAOC_37743 [Thalassiosira oceanica]|eukprot:EJK43780.1 hypothetical protein THAOC_37743 [Thalassiosira oceanica]
MPPKSAAKGTGAGASSSASRARSPSPEQEHVRDDSTLGGHSSSRRGRLTHGDPTAGRRPPRRQSPRSRSASTTARGKTAAAGSKNAAQSSSRRRASPRLAGPSKRSSRPSTAESRKDTEARSSGRQGTRRRSSSAKPAAACKLRGIAETNEDPSSDDESRVLALKRHCFLGKKLPLEKGFRGIQIALGHSNLSLKGVLHELALSYRLINPMHNKIPGSPTGRGIESESSSDEGVEEIVSARGLTEYQRQAKRYVAEKMASPSQPFMMFKKDIRLDRIRLDTRPNHIPRSFSEKGSIKKKKKDK